MVSLEKVNSFIILSILAISLSSCGNDAVSVNGPVNINGTVIDKKGYGVGYATVMELTRTPITVSSDGTFAISNVDRPYTILVKNNLDTSITVFQDLSSFSPVLMINTDVHEAVKNTGTIIALVPNHESGKRMAVTVLANDAYEVAGYGYGDSSLPVFIKWPRQHSLLSGNAVFLRELLNSNGEVDSFINFAVRPFTLTPGNFCYIDLRNIDTVYRPETGSIAVSVPQGTGGFTISAYVSFPGFSINSDIPYFSKNLTSTVSIKYPYGQGMPIPFNLKFLISNSNTQTTIKNISPSPSTTIDLGNPAVLLYPSKDTTGVNHQTVFAYDPFGTGRVYINNLIEQGPQGLKLAVVTSEKEFKIPRLFGFGITLDSGKVYNWNVMTIDGFGSINKYASWEIIKNQQGQVMYSLSETRSFRMGNE